MRMEATDTAGCFPTFVIPTVWFELLVTERIVTVSDAGRHTPRRVRSTWPSKRWSNTEIVIFGQSAELSGIRNPC